MGTKIMTDSSTALNAANLNKYCAGDGTVGTSGKGHMMYSLQIRYTGAAWEAVAGFGFREQISNIGLTWDGTNQWLTVDLSGCDNTFTSYPAVQATPTHHSDAVFWTKAAAVDADTVRVRFYNGSTLARETSESSNMRFNLTVSGEI